MGKLSSQRRIAASLLNCGVSRVYFMPYHEADIQIAITRNDIRSLIKSGIISRRSVHGTSRARAKKYHEEKKLGRHRSFGSRKGTRNARYHRKRAWITKIRAIRRKLKNYRDSGMIAPPVYRDVYRKAKGGIIHHVRHLRIYMREHKLLAK